MAPSRARRSRGRALAVDWLTQSRKNRRTCFNIGRSASLRALFVIGRSDPRFIKTREARSASWGAGRASCRAMARSQEQQAPFARRCLPRPCCGQRRRRHAGPFSSAHWALSARRSACASWMPGPKSSRPTSVRIERCQEALSRAAFLDSGSRQARISARNERVGGQSNSELTEVSSAMRRIASPSSGAIGSWRIREEAVTPSVA